MSGLPVQECLPEIIAAVRNSTPVVLKAPPGAGKTTGIPPALIDQDVCGDGQTLLIQPRRLAARAAASRLATLMDTNLGGKVGYQVRFDKRLSQQTRLIAMTPGILLRRLHGDPLLENVSCLLLDEFHERSLEMDLALGMLQRIRTTLRPELRLIVMSATLDPGPIVEFLGEAEPIISEGRFYPVDVQYSKTLSRDPIDQQVADALPDAARASDGDLLVFLPGLGEIRRTRRRIETDARAMGASVLELYGDLPPDRQDEVLSESPQRKIILATNVAETSITIPGVTGVIDSGLARVMRFDPQVGLPRLQLEPISQASADQRAGRAGRIQPGVCHRLWPAASHSSRRACDTPEIERCDFSDALLTLAAWGEREVFDFPWLTPPPESAVAAARELLLRLHAIAPDASLTEMGKRMLSLPLHPRLARFMLAATELSVQDDAALAAAMLTERDPFRNDRNSPMHTADAGCDITDRVARLKASFAGDSSGVQNQSAAKQIKRVAKQIGRLAESASTASTSSDEPSSIRLRQALLTAYPDRVALRREPGGDRGVMVGRRGVRLHPSSRARSGELFLCVDIDSQGSEAMVRSAAAIDPSWLDPQLIREVDEPFFDPSLDAVVARRRTYYEDLILRESPIECKPNPEVADLLAQHARANLTRAMPDANSGLQAYIDRIRFLIAAMPELELPPLDDRAIDQALVALCRQRTTISELRSAPWLDHLRSRYDYAQQQSINKLAPTRMTVPSGNAIAIRYAADKPPIMEVRIQELFGWKETPRIAGGKVPIQLHLLGPNHRPQQVTDDLASFWDSTYAQVRKDLRRRYPKHHWPEDPTNAQATRNGLKPRA